MIVWRAARALRGKNDPPAGGVIISRGLRGVDARLQRQQILLVVIDVAADVLWQPLHEDDRASLTLQFLLRLLGEFDVLDELVDEVVFRLAAKAVVLAPLLGVCEERGIYLTQVAGDGPRAKRSPRQRAQTPLWRQSPAHPVFGSPLSCSTCAQRRGTAQPDLGRYPPTKKP